MIEVKKLRNDFDTIKKALEKRNCDFNLDYFKDLDKKRRDLLLKIEEMKNKQNEVSKQVPILKKDNKNVDDILHQMKLLSDEIKMLEPQIRQIDEDIENFLFKIPNIPSENVSYGTQDTDNIEIRKVLEIKNKDFDIKPHWEIGENLKILDFKAASKVTGSRFTFYKGLGAKLERAVINFMLDTHTKDNKYTEIFPPFLVNRNSMQGTGQLPKFEEDAFKVLNTDYFLIPTAEVPVTNLHKDEILEGNMLPICYCAYSACFRAEAGSAGRDTRGLIRQHQFNKVELIKFTKPEESYKELEKLTNDAENILKLLDLPYRVVKLCGGDLGFSAAMTYDLEVWMRATCSIA